MTEFGPRVPQDTPKLVGRGWHDVAPGLEGFLENLSQLATVVNVLIENTRISEHTDGSTSVEIEGGGSGHAYFHGGA